MNVKFGITLQGDSEGYVVFECPYCESEFKLRADEYQDEENPFEDLFCPYCGLTKSKQDYFSKEVIEKVEAIAYNYMVDQINKTLGEMKRSFNKPGNIIKMDFKPLKKVNVKDLKGIDSTETAICCEDCSRTVKVLFSAGASKAFCPYCGVDISYD